MKILFLMPQCYPGPGGIPVYMRRLRETLNEYACSRGAIVHCLSLNDREQDLSLHPRPVDSTVFLGCGRSKARFVTKATQWAWRNHYALAIVGLLDMAPVAAWLQLTGLIGSYIVLLHGSEAWSRAAIITRLAACNARAIVATTRYTATEFAHKNGIAVVCTRIIPLCIAESRSAIRARAHGEPRQHNHQEFTLLAVGRLDNHERQKGIDTLIEAMPLVAGSFPGVRLIVAGGGDDLPRLQALVGKVGVTGSVKLLGVVADSTLQQLYRDCDVLVLPSRQEGFGIVFLEAMSYGKPCIGGAHGGIPEVILDGETGYLVPHGDVNAVARCVVRLADNPVLTIRMGSAGRQELLQKYCYDSFSSNFSRLFDSLLLSDFGEEALIQLSADAK